MDSLNYSRKASDYYGASDMNRVESWIQYLANLMISAGVEPDVRARKAWVVADIPRQGDFKRIREDIYRLRDAIYSAMPNWRPFSIAATTTGVDEWNAWEWDLSLISLCVQGMIDTGKMFKQAEDSDSNPIWMEANGTLNS